MNQGEIAIGAATGFDVTQIVESGQTFLWRREDGDAYSGGEYDGWHLTGFTDADGRKVGIRVRQSDGYVEWQSNVEAEDTVVRMLGLNTDMERVKEEIKSDTVGDSLVRNAVKACDGLRKVDDPLFPCLISFICSPQMRVSRIHSMQVELAHRFGDSVAIGEHTIDVYPSANQLAQTSEESLREAGLGYRAPYVLKTSRRFAGDQSPVQSISGDYPTAREELKKYTGVGDKVADCISLYALDFPQAVPIDTWMKTAVEEHYEATVEDEYESMSEFLRERWGSHAGYAQMFVFDYLRRQ